MQLQVSDGEAISHAAGRKDFSELQPHLIIMGLTKRKRDSFPGVSKVP